MNKINNNLLSNFFSASANFKTPQSTNKISGLGASRGELARKVEDIARTVVQSPLLICFRAPTQQTHKFSFGGTKITEALTFLSRAINPRQRLSK